MYNYAHVEEKWTEIPHRMTENMYDQARCAAISCPSLCLLRAAIKLTLKIQWWKFSGLLRSSISVQKFSLWPNWIQFSVSLDASGHGDIYAYYYFSYLTRQLQFYLEEKHQTLLNVGEKANQRLKITSFVFNWNTQ